jgi:mRNA interferase HigB
VELLGRPVLESFARKHAAARKPLVIWSALVAAATWNSLAELRATFSSADYVSGHVVFNIGGNKFRLIASVDFSAHRVLAEYVLTHAEYDKGAWKK